MISKLLATQWIRYSFECLNGVSKPFGLRARLTATRPRTAARNGGMG